MAVDLGDQHRISEVHLYPHNREGHTALGFPEDYEVQVSSDGKTWSTVVTRTGEVQDENVRVLGFDSTEARHVRVVGTKLKPDPTDNNLYSMQFTEMEVYAHDQ